ncbi:MAG: ORF6N domain-containing protein [Saprospiraceae bacterium]
MPEEIILKRILIIRSEKVILDFHLTEFYEVDTRTLKQAVKRNIERFPDDFRFELTTEEVDLLVSQNVIPSKSNLGGAVPSAFTETGVAMLSSVLNSPRSIEINIAIMRTFVAIRKLALNYQELMLRIDEIEKSNEVKFSSIFQILRHLTSPESKRQLIGFKQSKK